MQSSGGLGAVSFGLTETVVGLIVFVVVLFLVWKLVKVLWAASSN
jgi:hypothetical protein